MAISAGLRGQQRRVAPALQGAMPLVNWGDSEMGWAGAAFLGMQGPVERGRNGVKMVEVEQELLEIDGLGETGNTTESDEREGASENKRAKRAPVKDGLERLRQAVDRRLGKNSAKLADVLVAMALKGELAYTKVMVELAEHMEPREQPEEESQGLTRAQLLALEPEWQEGDEEERGWGTGNRD